MAKTRVSALVLRRERMEREMIRTAAVIRLEQRVAQLEQQNSELRQEFDTYRLRQLAVSLGVAADEKPPAPAPAGSGEVQRTTSTGNTLRLTGGAA